MACARSFHSSLYSAKIVVEKVPALGESITEGSIASWAKKEGDAVAVDDVIVIVETDKVTVDIKSTYAGVFKKKLVTDNVSSPSDHYYLALFIVIFKMIFNRLLLDNLCTRLMLTPLLPLRRPPLVQHLQQRHLL